MGRIGEFLRYLESNGRARNTIENARSYYRIMEREIGPLETITVDDLRQWIATNHRKPVTIRRILAALSNFRRWADLPNPVDELRERRELPPDGRYEPHPLDWEDVERMLHLPLPDRERVFLHVLALTGLRRNEALDLRVEDVDLQRRILIVRCGKGGKRREVGIVPRLARVLETYLPTCRDRLFPFRRSWANKLVRRAGEMVGVRCWPHRLRHSFATKVLNEAINNGAEQGLSLAALQYLLGHAKIATTMQFYARVRPTQARDFLTACLSAAG